ncbi:hypothetical protein ACHQM5_027497 [Ranunculus cassubicifolius]
MEALVLVAEHRDQYYRSRGFGRSPSRGFRNINCRSFYSEAGILPTPVKYCYGSPTSNGYSSPKTPSSVHTNSVNCKTSRSNKRNSRINAEGLGKCGLFNSESCCSELWAGPTYCNSPPPSSLPIPKFSMRRNRSVSPELPVKSFEVMLPPMSKSAPTSPRRESSTFRNNCFFSDAFATKDLRRILHLDFDDK